MNDLLAVVTRSKDDINAIEDWIAREQGGGRPTRPRPPPPASEAALRRPPAVAPPVHLRRDDDAMPGPPGRDPGRQSRSSARPTASPSTLPASAMQATSTLKNISPRKTLEALARGGCGRRRTAGQGMALTTAVTGSRP